MQAERCATLACALLSRMELAEAIGTLNSMLSVWDAARWDAVGVLHQIECGPKRYDAPAPLALWSQMVPSVLLWIQLPS